MFQARPQRYRPHDSERNFPWAGRALRSHQSIMKSEIITLNNLFLHEAEIFTNPDVSDSHDEDASQYELLKDILQKTDDLSSYSRQLDDQWVLWFTEYHLSSARANILKALDLLYLLQSQ